MRKITRIVLIGLILSGLKADGRIENSLYDPETRQYWQRCEAGLQYNGQYCTGNVLLLSWQRALQYCATIADAKSWRLATREELLRYYYHHGRERLHYINLYWTASTDFERPELAWYLIPELAWVYTNYKELDGLILCVADVS